MLQMVKDLNMDNEHDTRLEHDIESSSAEDKKLM